MLLVTWSPAAPPTPRAVPPAAVRPGRVPVASTSPPIIGARVDCVGPSCTLTWETARLPVRVYAGPRPDRIDRSAPVATAFADTPLTVAPRDPTRRTYFELVPRDERRGPVVADRTLGLAGAPDARDLGGYRTTDGRTVRWGRLFRTDGLASVTDDDRARLDALGLPSSCPIPRRAVGAAGESDPTTRRARARDRARLRALARGRVPQWVSCGLADDPTGWGPALILTTLGVPRETVVANHLLGGRLGAAPERAGLERGFEAVRREYGSFGRYLVDGLGLSERQWLTLRTRYLTGGPAGLG